ncbi:MAG: PAS domain S-box protein [Chthoniobacteraceae bacterium]
MELEQANERFFKAFHESPIPSGIQSLPDQRFVDVNPCFAGIAGFRREEMIGSTAGELFLWEKPGLADHWAGSLLGGETVRDQEARIRTKYGALHEVLVSASLVALAREPHMLVLAQDVAERVSCARARRWRRSASWLPVSPMISIIFSL